jgi:putative DNA primase/helicase
LVNGTTRLVGRTSLVSKIEFASTPSLHHSNPCILDQLRSLLTRYVILPEHAAEALAVWIVHTYAFELRDVTTYVALESPVRRCGKSTLLTVLSRLVNRPLVAANVSPSALYRAIEELRPTLMIDEADTFLKANDELTGILNAGYHRATAYVLRVSNEGK